MQRNYWSAEIVLGASLGRSIKENRAEYHQKALELLHVESQWNRIGARRQIALTQKDYIHYPEEICSSVISKVQSLKVDSVLFDFSCNINTPVRDPLLMQLEEAMRRLCSSDICSEYIILLSVLPNINGASIDYARRLVNGPNTNKLSVTFLGGDGVCFKLTSEGIVNDEKTGDDFRNLYREYNEHPEKLLKRKCVQRLGHFKQAGDANNITCRWKSYYLQKDSVEELADLFGLWWEEKGKDIEGIIYDCPNNPSLKDAVVAIASRNQVGQCERYESVVQDDELIGKYRTAGQILLILDYIQSGEHLIKVTSELKDLGITLHKKIVCAVNKQQAETGVTGLHGYDIEGFIALPPHHYYNDCIQCTLGIPFDEDIQEKQLKIKTFDMLNMISKAGWEKEPAEEVPGNLNQYEILPNFAKMFEKNENWIAYKMLKQLFTLNLPDDLVIVHPDEGDSSRLATCLRHLGRQNRFLTTLPIPRANIIDDFIENKRSWEEILENARRDGSQWLNNIDSTRANGAIILDIFYSTGSTARALIHLCEYINWPAVAIMVAVDFNPTIGLAEFPQIARYSLYDWESPRKEVG